MNIDDVNIKDVNTGKGDKLDRMFERQEELAKKYTKIEHENGFIFPEDMPLDLHDPHGQLRLKDFAWRITEELGEALEAFRVHDTKEQHYDEELADAFHFLLEMTLLADVDLEKFIPKGTDKLDWLFNYTRCNKMRDYTTLSRYVGHVVEALAVACNCLKNKPWKTSHMMTDVDYFQVRMFDVYFRFAELCWKSGIDDNRLFELYFRKSEVNKFRQRSNY